MKRALFIFNAYSRQSGPQRFYERMKEELLPYGYLLEAKTNREILNYIDKKGDIAGIDLSPYAFCLYLDKDEYVAAMLEKEGMRLFNRAESIRLCDDKMLTHIALAKENISMPKTINAPLNYSGYESSNSFLSEVEALLPYPMVAKENYGSLGKGVFLLSNHDDLVAFEKSHWNVPHLYQEFIRSSFGFDHRIIVIGGHYVAGMKRVNLHGDFRSNLAQGGQGEKVDIPFSYRALAEKVSTLLKLDYGGVDLLDDANGNPVLCEVNSNAFITGIEETTGINVAARYAAYINETMRAKE